ncbi:hypothetical protein PQX77_018295 [Marasmius sp. AFHP31]|nr:hypothetical protein PQX77_018295 [Marasmius sp. AFHP31]
MTYTAFQNGKAIPLFVESNSGSVTNSASASDSGKPSTTPSTTTSTAPTTESTQEPAGVTTQTIFVPASGAATNTITPSASSSETSATSKSAPANDGRLGIIVGSVMGALASIALLILLLICLRRKGRKGHHEVFQRDMILEKLNGNGETGALRKEKSLGEFEKGKDYNFDPISSITPLHKDFRREFDDRSTLAGSMYSRLSADTRTLAPSGISGVSTAYTEGELDIPKVPPLMPIAESLTPSLPPFQAPFRPKTERQMQIEQRIIELQSRFIVASGSGPDKVRTRAELKDKIERVKELRESAWAHGGKGEVPDVLID